MTPEKWEHYNKVVWPPGYVVPETGLPKAKEVGLSFSLQLCGSNGFRSRTRLAPRNASSSLLNVVGNEGTKMKNRGKSRADRVFFRKKTVPEESFDDELLLNYW